MQCQRAVASAPPQDERMVHPRDDLFVHDPFQHPEIGHHAAFRIVRALGGTPLHRHEQPVRMAVDLAARTVVSFERVSRLERKFLGQSDYCHRDKDIYFRRNRKAAKRFSAILT